MAQRIKTLATMSDNLEFYLQDLRGRREPTPGSCPLIYAHISWHVCAHIQFKKRIKTNFQKDTCLHTGVRILVRLPLSRTWELQSWLSDL